MWQAARRQASCRTRLARLLLAGIVSLAPWMMARPASAAVSNIGVYLEPSGQSVVVGQTVKLVGELDNQPGDPPTTVNSLTLNPSCNSPDFETPCPPSQPDLGVFGVQSAVGQTGTSCDFTFAASGPDANGDFTLTPPSPFVVPPDAPDTSSGRCLLDITLLALKAPSDIATDVDGLQTLAVLTLNVPPPDPAPIRTGTDRITVSQPSATVAVEATPTATIGQPISASATVTGAPGGPTPTGYVNFSLFGPDDPGCSSPLQAFNNVPLTDSGTVSSPTFPAAVKGTYRWIATYNGDATYASSGNNCGDPGSTSEVDGAPTTLTVAASPSVSPGHDIFATATLAGGASPTGTITFNAWRNKPICDGPPDLTSTATVNDVGEFTSNHFTISTEQIGTYRFVASYSGDASNAASTNACDAPGTSVAVMEASDVQPTITLDTSATPATLDAPGGTFTFHLTVTNTSPKLVTTKTLNDKVYGNLDGRGSCKVGIALAATPGPSDSYTCSYTGDFSGAANATQTATVSASALDEAGNEATATHDTAVSLTAAPAAPADLAATTPAAASALTPLAGTDSGSTGGSSGTTGSSSGSLAVTGAAIGAQLRLALGFLAAGLLLVTRRRRHPEPAAAPVLTRAW